ncbi:MAG: two-component system phosphate regulon sensor histidine kinase PhoR [Arenicella sp.]|jgi:two-component system phosphate regulon sensor histidine kinase PhoR
MQHDLWKFVGLLFIAAVFGYTVEHILLVMLLVSLSIITWQAYRLNLLFLWAENPNNHPMPEVSGQLYSLYRSILRRNAKNSKRKRLLSAYLTQFRKAVSALPDAIVLVDDNGKIEWANKNADTVLGIRWPEDGNVRFSDLIRYPEVDALLGNANSKKKPPEQGVVVNSTSNNDLTISFKCIRYTDTLRMVIARDVSRLVKINQMQSDFVANVSHELKTPLTVLKGYVEILRDNPDLPLKFAKPLAQMNLQSTRMELIVGDLLYLAKLEDSAYISPHEPVNVTALINTIIEAVGPLIVEKRHKIELDIDCSLSLNGASTELHSAFSNLITNAIKYTASNGVIKVSWKSGQRNGQSCALFSIRDNGYGIAPQHIERLTQRFYRVDTDRSREGGGTGLGLAIVKHVLQRHAAELEIESREEKGSVFRCVFVNSLIIKSKESSKVIII